MKEKFVIIGAGSAMFTRGLLSDMIRSGFEADLALVDIDPTALEVAYKLAQKMVALKSARIQLSASVDRRQVLPGATAVICTIGVGGRRAWEQDVFIPRKYGIYMPVGDTVGPGGTSRALRMIPAMVDIARDVLDLAPNALFFNYGNPMAPVCRGVRKATGANMIGLCIGVEHVRQYLANVLQVSPSELQSTAIGINHLTWFVSVLVNGQDALPELHRIADQKIALAPDSTKKPNDDQSPEVSPFGTSLGDPFSWHLFKRFGAFPAVLDRHVTEFFPQFFREGHYYGRTLGIDVFSFEGTIAYGDQEYAQMQADALSDQPLMPEYFDHASGEHEQALDIIHSIRQGLGKVYSANLPNSGQVPNLPLEAIIEAPAIADHHGLRPIAQNALPSALVGTLANRYQWVETVVEAALEGSRDKFIQALILDGAVHTIHQAEKLADELLIAQAAYLPWVH